MKHLLLLSLVLIVWVGCKKPNKPIDDHTVTDCAQPREGRYLKVATDSFQVITWVKSNIYADSVRYVVASGVDNSYHVIAIRKNIVPQMLMQVMNIKMYGSLTESQWLTFFKDGKIVCSCEVKLKKL